MPREAHGRRAVCIATMPSDNLSKATSVNPRSRSSIGVNLASKGLYDGSAYAGLSFKAKVGSSSTRSFRVKIGDVNTHGQLGTCKSCWNHFGKDLQIGTDWQEYVVMFSEVKQADGWGEPRPATPDGMTYLAIAPLPAAAAVAAILAALGGAA